MDPKPEEGAAKTPQPTTDSGKQETGRAGTTDIPAKPRHGQRYFCLHGLSHIHADGHVSGKSYIIRLALALTLAGGLFIGLYASFQKWRQYQQNQIRLETIEKDLKGVDAMIATESGYPKCKLAEEGVELADAAIAADAGNTGKWTEIREGYMKIINAESHPVSGSDFIVPNVLVDMAFIPKGSFAMGAQTGQATGQPEGAPPPRNVSIGKDLWIGRTEITTAQFKVFFPHHACKTWHMLKLDNPRQPACDVDWHQADRFCSLLSDLERTAGRLPKGYAYRLPTEAEWEYACRAGTETAYYWGDSFRDTGAEFANSLDKRAAVFAKVQYAEEEEEMPDTDNYLISAPVKRFKPNAFGLFDMSGNVSEWCHDWYNPNAYSQLPLKSPVQAEPVVVTVEKSGEFDRKYSIQATCKVIRGGSWGNLPSQLRSGHRDFLEPQQRFHGIGFRIALAPSIKTPQQPTTTAAPAK